MSKGKSYMFKGSVALALALLIFATTLILALVKNPLRTSLISFQHQFSASSSVCNYTKGRWVANHRRPLYSGFGCKQWLSRMWACRLMDRTDFSFEGYQWNPEGCKMPEFERSAFLRRQQFQSLMCMATGGEEIPNIENVGWEYGLVKPKGALRPDGWAYRFPNTNTTILYYWSASLSDLVPINTSTADSPPHVAMHLDRPPAFMRQYIHRFDVLVLNTGHHWNRGKFEGNHWVMHMRGKPNKDKYFSDIMNAKNFTVHSIARFTASSPSSVKGLLQNNLPKAL